MSNILHVQQLSCSLQFERSSLRVGVEVAVFFGDWGGKISRAVEIGAECTSVGVLWVNKLGIEPL
jgi:hypothetical protein